MDRTSCVLRYRIRTTAEVATLNRDRSASEYLEALDDILEESERTSQVVDSLMLLARADSGKESLELVPVDARAVVHSAAKQGERLARNHGVEFKVKLPAGRGHPDKGGWNCSGLGIRHRHWHRSAGSGPYLRPILESRQSPLPRTKGEPVWDCRSQSGSWICMTARYPCKASRAKDLFLRFGCPSRSANAPAHSQGCAHHGRLGRRHWR